MNLYLKYFIAVSWKQSHFIATFQWNSYIIQQSCQEFVIFFISLLPMTHSYFFNFGLLISGRYQNMYSNSSVMLSWPSVCLKQYLNTPPSRFNISIYIQPIMRRQDFCIVHEVLRMTSYNGKTKNIYSMVMHILFMM